MGFGATLRGALDVLPPGASVVVAEKVRTVARLVAGELAHVAGRPLDDPRASVVHEDVAGVLARTAEPWDVILLDVDNGPHWASFRGNARLYSPAGLAAARRALAPGGSLAVWSGYPADAFLGRLREAGFIPRRILLHERGRVRARAYVATRAA
jgi:spermidine synthase